MRSFFLRTAGAVLLLLVALSQAKTVHAQWNPFSGMSTREAAEVTGGFIWRHHPVGVLMDVIQGNRTGWEDSFGGERTSIDPDDTRENPNRFHPIDSVTQRLPTATGSILDALTARLVGFIAFIMGLIVAFLGKVILLLVNVLLGFLSYNGFATAPPVVIGWKMVRDLVNMFFIVILILASYATILGWRTGELHVKTILPKVLLAAVLVNFSKTIVALLIDASQIVMLTFVNAFGAIGAGNFTNALHLPLIQGASYGQQLQNSVSSSAATVAANGAGQVILDVVLAAAFQIFLLIVAIGVMLMMVIFVVARIVGLWMLLIFSPVPFLASALPGTMKKVLGSQVEKYWGRLSGLLTGGPIMAFWLWLTFATLSAQGADERLSLFENTQAAELGNTFGFGMVQNGASMFITAIGNAQGLGSYLVAIAMMMMGLEAAMDAANAVGGSAGDLMKKVGNKSRDWGQRAALFAAGGGAVAAGGLALRGAGAVGGAALGAIDRRKDIRGRLAAAARRRIPFASQNKWLREQQFYNRNEEAKRQAEYEKIMNDPKLTKAQKEFEMKKIGRNEFWTGDRAGTKALQAVQAGDAMKKGTNEKAFDDELQAFKDDAKAAMKVKGVDDATAKRASDRVGKQEANRLRIEELEKGKAALSDVGKTEIEKNANKELRQKFDDEIKKIRNESPHLITDKTEYEKQMGQVRENFSKLSDDAKGNFDVLKNIAYGDAFKTDKDTGMVTVGDRADIARTRKKLQGNRAALENFNTMVKFIEESNGGIHKDQLRNLSVERDAQDRARVFQTDVKRDSSGALNATGSYQISYEQQKALDKVQSVFKKEDAYKEEFPGGPAMGWVSKDPGGGIVRGPDQVTSLMNASRVVGVGQTINSIPDGIVPGKNNGSYRDAAVRSIAVQTGGAIRDTTKYLNETREYPDATGATVQKTNAEILRSGSNVPQSVRDLAMNGYQKNVVDILPVLDGVGELSENQQIEFMAQMGQNNVGQALDDRMINDLGQRETVRKVKEMVSQNSGTVTRWFEQQYKAEGGEGRMQELEEYREHEAWKKTPAAGRAWEPKVVEDMETLRGMSEEDRNAFLKTIPTLERETRDQYNAYVSYTAHQQKEAKFTRNEKYESSDWRKEYATFSKYSDARVAMDQFQKNKGAKSAANKARGAVGGGERRERKPRGPRT